MENGEIKNILHGPVEQRLASLMELEKSVRDPFWRFFQTEELRIGIREVLFTFLTPRLTLKEQDVALKIFFVLQDFQAIPSLCEKVQQGSENEARLFARELHHLLERSRQQMWLPDEMVVFLRGRCESYMPFELHDTHLFQFLWKSWNELALDFLGLIRNGDSADLMLRACATTNPLVRSSAYNALGRLAAVGSIPEAMWPSVRTEMLGFLSLPEETMQVDKFRLRPAALVLQKTGGLRELLGLMRGCSKSVRYAGCEALFNAVTEGVLTEPLRSEVLEVFLWIAAQKRHDDLETDKKYATKGIALLLGEDAIPVLVSLMSKYNSILTSNCCGGIADLVNAGKIPQQKMPLVVDALRHAVKLSVLPANGGDDFSIQDIPPLLAKLPVPEATRYMIEWIRRGTGTHRALCFRALMTLARENEVPAGCEEQLVELFRRVASGDLAKRFSEKNQNSVQCEAICRLGEIKDEASVPLLLECAGKTSGSRQSACHKALAQIMDSL
jgi:HEAT repeat protein